VRSAIFAEARAVFKAKADGTAYLAYQRKTQMTIDYQRTWQTQIGVIVVVVVDVVVLSAAVAVVGPRGAL